MIPLDAMDSERVDNFIAAVCEAIDEVVEKMVDFFVTSGYPIKNRQ